MKMNCVKARQAGVKVQKAYEWKRLRGGILCWSGARSASSAARWTVDTVVNLEEYPMKDLKSANARNVIDGLRQALLADGYCVMRRFLRTEAVDAAVAEVRARESTCFVHSRRVNMWSENPSQHRSLPQMALRRMSSIDSYGVVARDELYEHGSLLSLYSSPAFAAFAANITGHEKLHALGDELAGCSGEILCDGQSRAWQFAQAPVVAIAMLQRPLTGGLALGFRNVDVVLDAEGGVVAAAESDEEGSSTAVEAVRTILQAAEIEHEAAEMGLPMSWRQIMEDMDPEAGAVYHKTGPLSVQSLALSEGDVLLMQASRSVLRFSQILGERPLVTATFCFEESAGRQLAGNERKRLYGRKKAGTSPPASSTFSHSYRPLSGGDGGAATQGEYVAVVSEGHDGLVRELVRSTPSPRLACSCMGVHGRGGDGCAFCAGA